VSAPTKRAKGLRWQVCHVLLWAEGQRRLWQFGRSGSGVKLAAERPLGPAEPLPAGAAGQPISVLWQPRLNVAWMPPGNVFIRVIELPACPPDEVAGMVEFRLDGLSPLPPGHAAWLVETIPAPEGATQTAVVVMVARTDVVKYLGDLEQAGYYADRLELPLLREALSATGRDGVWFHLQVVDQALSCLVAWWDQGRLRNIVLWRLPADDRASAELTSRLGRVVWAGEAEGWHTPGTAWHLVAERDAAGLVLPALTEWLGAEIPVTPPSARAEVAAGSARALAAGNLIPVDVAARYRQTFIDRLWMRGVAVLVLVYLVVAAVYLGAVQYVQYQKRSVDHEAALLQTSFTNALQLKARVQVLQDQAGLKFAALDSWKAATDALPEEMTLSQLNFQGKARKIQIMGTVPADQQGKVTEYNEALSKAVLNGAPVFSKVATKSILAQPGRPASWSIECDLARMEL